MADKKTRNYRLIPMPTPTEPVITPPPPESETGSVINRLDDLLSGISGGNSSFGQAVTQLKDRVTVTAAPDSPAAGSSPTFLERIEALTGPLVSTDNSSSGSLIDWLLSQIDTGVQALRPTDVPPVGGDARLLVDYPVPSQDSQVLEQGLDTVLESVTSIVNAQQQALDATLQRFVNAGETVPNGPAETPQEAQQASVFGDMFSAKVGGIPVVLIIGAALVGVLLWRS